MVVEDPLQGEVTREYALHLPAHYDMANTLPTPLVIDYHGWTGNAHDDMVNLPWPDVADIDEQVLIDRVISWNRGLNIIAAFHINVTIYARGSST